MEIKGLSKMEDGRCSWEFGIHGTAGWIYVDMGLVGLVGWLVRRGSDETWDV
jgi:hypothetical protein